MRLQRSLSNTAHSCIFSWYSLLLLVQCFVTNCVLTYAYSVGTSIFFMMYIFSVFMTSFLLAFHIWIFVSVSKVFVNSNTLEVAYIFSVILYNFLTYFLNSVLICVKRCFFCQKLWHYVDIRVFYVVFIALITYMIYCHDGQSFMTNSHCCWIFFCRKKIHLYDLIHFFPGFPKYKFQIASVCSEKNDENIND